MLGTAESRFNFWLRVTVSNGELSTRAATGWGEGTACLDRLGGLYARCYYHSGAVLTRRRRAC